MWAIAAHGLTIRRLVVATSETSFRTILACKSHDSRVIIGINVPEQAQTRHLPIHQNTYLDLAMFGEQLYTCVSHPDQSCF